MRAHAAVALERQPARARNRPDGVAAFSPYLGYLVGLPGLIVTDDCPWKKVFEFWPERLPGLADAATVAVAIAHGYDAVATFDHKMVKKMRALGVDSYW